MYISTVYGWLIWTLWAITLILMQGVDPYGGITFDAPWYLRQAQFLLDGNGWHSLSPHLPYSTESIFFFLWPPVYPSLLAILAWVTHLPIQYVPLLLNILLGATLISYRKPLIWACLYFPAVMEASGQAWTEFPGFIFMIHALMSASKIHSSQPTTWIIPALFFALSLGTRYLNGLVGLIFLLPFFKEKKVFLNYILFTLSGLFISLTAIYFWYVKHNYLGGYGSFQPEIWWQAMKDSFRVALGCLNPFIPPAWQTDALTWLSPLFFSPFLLLAYKYRKKNIHAMETFVLLSIPILMVLIPWIMRGWFPIGTNHHRFYTFSSVLFCLILMSDWNLNTTLILKYILVVWIIFFPARWIYYHPQWDFNSFAKRVSETEMRYHEIPTKSLVVFGDKWIEWLRPDLHTWYPLERSMGHRCTSYQSMRLAISSWPYEVWFDLPSVVEKRIWRYHPSIVQWLKSQKTGVWKCVK